MALMKLAVAGAAGRMGRAVIRAVAQSGRVELCGALEREGVAEGEDAGSLAGVGELGVAVASEADDALERAEGVIDFSAPEASVRFAERAARSGLVHVVGATGMDEAQEKQIVEAAEKAVIVKSGNMSLGVNLLAALVEQAARALDAEDFDVEIAEMHHRRKVDAPSGTALLLGEAAAKGREVDPKEAFIRAREGITGPRVRGSIGFAASRGGSVVGEHDVIFAGEGERIILRHIAQDRAIFAHGAIKAALWARGKKPGLYSMRDVLGVGK